jgi:FHA domain
MIKCHACQTANQDSSRFCDECGSRLPVAADVVSQPPAYVPPPVEMPSPRPVSVTSIGVPPISADPEPAPAEPLEPGDASSRIAHATLVIERGAAPGTEFRLLSDEAVIGRWDADNGVFPEVDLDTHDHEAKVSRRHARIVRNNGSYVIEDLGSTNGTYVNRGRRLLPGSPQMLSDGDEVIVGKTFLRFHITQ